MHGINHWAGMMSGMALWTILSTALLVMLAAGIAALTVWAVKRAPASQPVPPLGTRDAEDLLRRRFAAGEIDDEEFVRRLGVLEGHVTAPRPPSASPESAP